MADTAPLAEVFESLDRAVTSSSKDWGEYWADAWLYGVLVGWDCDEAHQHDEVCNDGAAMREMAAKHRWDEETVARLRRYREAVRRATAREVPTTDAEFTAVDVTAPGDDMRVIAVVRRGKDGEQPDPRSST
jgi:hypothetical protein